ncbi:MULTISPECIES: hypothetical protein [Streptomyces]|uniref:hypothetical protein n=1 Tax=Streptomyces TaxID=1883 RepID=UPI000A4CFAFC|nr:hypothetical protein [Streptomyces qinglanensis]
MTDSRHSPLPGQDGLAPATLAFTVPSGRRRGAPVRFGRESRRDPQLPHRIRNGLLDDEGKQCVQVRLTAADAANPAARALLDAEAGTALRLRRVLDATRYAALFPRIIGYELDAAEPFLLYAAPRGIAAARTHVMGASDQRVLARDLMLALCLLDGQGLVLRGISPATVLWDGTSVQLWGLEGVARAGAPRTRWGRAPYCSPEQRRGEGLVDSRDAVWSVAQVLYQLVTGRHGPTDRAPVDLDEHRVLAETLRGAFAPRAADRPTPARLLDLLEPGAARRVRHAAVADTLGAEDVPIPAPLAAPRCRADLMLLDDHPCAGTPVRLSVKLVADSAHPWARPDAGPSLEIVAVPLSGAEVTPATVVYSPGNADSAQFCVTAVEPGMHRIRFTFLHHDTGVALQQVEADLDIEGPETAESGRRRATPRKGRS